MFVDPRRKTRTTLRPDRAPAWTSPAPEPRRHSPGRLAWLSIDHLPHGLIVLGESGTVLDANLQAEAIFGYGTNALIGLPISTLLPEQRAAAPGEAGSFLDVSHCIGTGATPFKGVRKDRAIVPLEIQFTMFVEGDSRYIAASIVDITTRPDRELAPSTDESSRFQRLVADIVARLGKVDPDGLDDAITDTLRQIVQTLQVDQAILWEKSLSDGAAVSWQG